MNNKTERETPLRDGENRYHYTGNQNERYISGFVRAYSTGQAVARIRNTYYYGTLTFDLEKVS